MVFNWFRRKFDKSEAESEPDSEQVAAIESEDEPAVDEPQVPASEEVATDYLAWAKAAYQNIQQQQESPPPAVELVEPVAAPISEDLELVGTEQILTDPEIETDTPIAVESNLTPADPQSDVTTDNSTLDIDPPEATPLAADLPITCPTFTD